MSTNDPLRTMRDEMADYYIVRRDVIEKWLATLDAHLALPRCPECGTAEPAHVLRNYHFTGYLYYAECGSMHCDYSRGAETEAEALAKFYVPVEVKG